MYDSTVLELATQVQRIHYTRSTINYKPLGGPYFNFFFPKFKGLMVLNCFFCQASPHIISLFFLKFAHFMQNLIDYPHLKTQYSKLNH